MYILQGLWFFHALARKAALPSFAPSRVAVYKYMLMLQRLPLVQNSNNYEPIHVQQGIYVQWFIIERWRALLKHSRVEAVNSFPVYFKLKRWKLLQIWSRSTACRLRRSYYTDSLGQHFSLAMGERLKKWRMGINCLKFQVKFSASVFHTFTLRTCMFLHVASYHRHWLIPQHFNPCQPCPTFTWNLFFF